MAKILIVHASFGEGHKRAAQALRGLPDSSCCDLLDFSHPFIKKVYSSGYKYVTKHCIFIWQILFSLAKKNIFSSLVYKINKLFFSSFLTYLEKTRPEVVVVTHFFPPSLLAVVKEKIGIKIICVITDIRVHPLWVNRCIDHYFAVVEATKDDLLSLGVDEGKITTGFIPIREGFLKESFPESLRKKFNIDSRPVILFVSSLR